MIYIAILLKDYLRKELASYSDNTHMLKNRHKLIIS